MLERNRPGPDLRVTYSHVPEDLPGQKAGDLRVFGNRGQASIRRTAPPRMPCPFSNEGTSAPLEMSHQSAALYN